MPLSEREQKLLEQLEQQLNADDPRFAETLNQRGHRSSGAAGYSPRHVVLGVLISVVGLAVVIAGVGTKLIPLGVLGFVIMVAGVCFAASGKGRGQKSAVRRRDRGMQTGTGAPSSFMQNLERKWDERQGRS